MSQESVIEVRDIHTSFGQHVVHDGLRFSVPRSQIIGIIGASGGGKSVLLREILALERPTSGSIEMLGVNMQESSDTELATVRRRIGVLFQNGALFSGLTVGQNVAVPLVEESELSPALIEEIVALRLALVGLRRSSRDLMPSELSGGMRKRAALARALALEPELVFLDEPTSGLDPINARAFDDLVRVLRAALRLTVVIVTHDLETLWSTCDRVVALAEGKIVADGPVAEVAKVNHPWLQEYFSKSKQT